jgi:DNA-binding transcriptional regulator YiaG
MADQEENPIHLVMNELGKDVSFIAEHLKEDVDQILRWKDGQETIPSEKKIKIMRLLWLKRARDKRAENKALGINKPRKPKNRATPNLTPDEIKRIRLEAGLTQSKFAELLGVSLPSVSNWERGGCQPRTQQALRILEFQNHNQSEHHFDTHYDSEPFQQTNRGSYKSLTINFTSLDASGIIDHGDNSISIYDERKGVACRITLTPALKKLLMNRLQNA